MSDTDLARSWLPEAKAPCRGGEPVRPVPKEKEGREPDATVLSARDLSCSDQLKPWSKRVEENKSEAALGREWGVAMLFGFGCVCGAVEDWGFQDVADVVIKTALSGGVGGTSTVPQGFSEEEEAV